MHLFHAKYTKNTFKKYIYFFYSASYFNQIYLNAPDIAITSSQLIKGLL